MTASAAAETTRACTIAVAELLNELAHDLETLGGELCSDHALASRHMHALQAIDTIVQKQKALSSLLVADVPALAIRQITLASLADRLIAMIDR